MQRNAIVVLGALVVVPVVGVLVLDREDLRPASSPEQVVELSGDTIPVGVVPTEVVEFLAQGRAWRAARALRPYLRGGQEPQREAILVAARAEAEWGGWERAKDYLEGRQWLDQVWDGEGWYWLGRAKDELGEDSGALQAYDRYLQLQPAGASSSRSATAALRRGLVLLRLGRRDEGAEALRRVTERAPAVKPWMDLLAAEALATVGDTSATRAVAATAPEGAGIRHRARLADIRAAAARDSTLALSRAHEYARSGGTPAHQAELLLIAGRIARARGETATAGRNLREVLSTAPAAGAASTAAGLLLQFANLTVDDRLTIAEIDERHGNFSRAVQGYRAWLAGSSPAAARRTEVRLRLGRSLFNAGDFSAAETALQPLIAEGGATAREAHLLVGRAQYRRGARQQAFRTFEALADSHPGSAEGSEGLFLVADLNHDDGKVDEAARIYRRVANGFRGTDRAGLSLMRLGGIRYQQRDFSGAAAVWEEYRSSYPTGDRWLEATYWAALSGERSGEQGAATALYAAIAEKEPLSYYSVLSSARRQTPYWPIALAQSPPVNEAAQTTVDGWMDAVDILREAGLYAEADAEVQRLVDEVRGEPAVLYTLAEALNERGYALRGIRIGQRIQEGGQPMNLRLLHILYPFPFRKLIEAEAKEAGLDPFVVAALTRQESLFTPRISSAVGARGLMQIMPETGAALARGIGIDGWDPELLFNPEINVHLGIRYLADQMRTYNRSLPSVFSAYNAGPHRVEVWKNFPEYGDAELFTERIPYRETRDYVKILTRNIALYRGLYGGQAAQPASPGTP